MLSKPATHFSQTEGGNTMSIAEKRLVDIGRKSSVTRQIEWPLERSLFDYDVFCSLPERTTGPDGNRLRWTPGKEYNTEEGYRAARLVE
jgi:hypothetical protein